MRIIGPPSAPLAVVVPALAAQADVHPEFAGVMFGALWRAATRYGLDPVGVVAQSAKETAFGRFGGAVRREMFNPCGLKIRKPGFVAGTDGDKTLAHAQFASWEVGALAHCQHLRAYAGMPVPHIDLVVDPRYEAALEVGLSTPVVDFEGLGGKWAPSATYGAEVVAIAVRLGGRA